eukprot:TRINITY_DN3201_c0_g1_i2.p1 TRINITY_DN3201_c0_g1~~TRINITY_DN3201_c0_g1_i2.p1  ORF type:complete len:531 (-),score=145.62 TRINITY_DN3201_c0_g1_i2:137-1708(-)
MSTPPSSATDSTELPSPYSFPKLVYHALPDRFARSDLKTSVPRFVNDGKHFFGGSLFGIERKMKYIKNLGFQAVMIGPFMKNQRESYHGYHIISHTKLDKRLCGYNDQLQPIGDELSYSMVDDNPDISSLIWLKESAEANGLQLIFDLVPNHVYKTHPIIEQARKNPEMHDWFSFDKDGKINKFFLDITDLPKVNLKSKGAREYMIEHALNLAKYCHHFRVDHALGCDKQFLIELCERVHKQQGNSFKIFGEIWMDDFLMSIEQPRFELFLKTFDMMSDPEKAELRKLREKHASSLEAQDWVTKLVAGLGSQKTRVMDGMIDFSTFFNVRDALCGNSTTAPYLVPDRSSFLPKDFVLVSFMDNHDTDRALFYAKNKPLKAEKHKRDEDNSTQTPSTTSTSSTVASASTTTSSDRQNVDMDKSQLKIETQQHFFIVFKRLCEELRQTRNQNVSLSFYSGSEVGQTNEHQIFSMKYGDRFVRMPFPWRSPEGAEFLKFFCESANETGLFKCDFQSASESFFEKSD